jgi:hypothetical protein
MPSPSTSHPDRVAATLANLPDARRSRGDGPFALPGDGARDCRIDLKLLLHRAERAAAVSPRAAARLAAWPRAAHPDLWAGTVQDGTARGFAAALEEAIALADPAPAAPPAAAAAPHAVQRFVGKELRKKKDLLVATGGARVRFSRKEGLLFVERGESVHSSNCLRFEARRDVGTLDAFAGDDGERPRLYSAQFLQPQEYVVGAGHAELRLQGRIGRGPVGWDCSVVVRGDDAETTVRVRVQIDNRQPGWRLRARFLGLPLAAVEHACTDVRDVVQNDAGGFVAFTLVRACGTLLVDGAPVAVPGAQCPGPLVHEFRLGHGRAD